MVLQRVIGCLTLAAALVACSSVPRAEREFHRG